MSCAEITLEVINLNLFDVTGLDTVQPGSFFLLYVCAGKSLPLFVRISCIEPGVLKVRCCSVGGPKFVILYTVIVVQVNKHCQKG